MDRIEEPPGTFYLDGCILYYIFRNEWAEEDQSNWDDHCEETYKLEYMPSLVEKCEKLSELEG